MYCNNCGSKLEEKDLFCGSCGKKVEPEKKEENKSETKTEAPKAPINNNDDSPAPLILGIFSILTSGIFIVSLVLAIIGLVLYKKNKKKNPNYSVAGKALNIIGIVLSILIVAIIAVIISVSLFAYNKVKDKTHSYIKDTPSYTENYQRVGIKDYGYIDAPKDWIKHSPVTENDVTLYQYSNDDQDEVITMSKYDATAISFDQVLVNINNSLTSNNAENLITNKETVNYYSATSMSCYYPSEKVYLKIWVFEDYSDVIHYVTIESSNEDSDIFDLIDTYKLYY